MGGKIPADTSQNGKHIAGAIFLVITSSDTLTSVEKR